MVDPRTAVADLLAKYPDQPVVPIVLHEVALEAKDPIWADDLYQVALYRRASLNSASRSMLARIAEQEKDADTVVDLLDGHVYIDQNSDDLRVLARGFVNGTVRQAAGAFVDKLPADLESHQRVSWDLLRAIWATDLPYIRRAKAASLVLDRLVRLLVQRKLFPSAYSAMIANSRDQPLLEECLVAWARGHFISLAS